MKAKWNNKTKEYDVSLSKDELDALAQSLFMDFMKSSSTDDMTEINNLYTALNQARALKRS